MANLKYLLCMVFFATLGTASLESILSQISTLSQATRDIVHIGSDGVVRAFNSDGVVISYIQLSNSELAILESDKPEHKKQWISTDGRDVEHQDCMTPHEHVLPAKFKAQQGPLSKRIQLCSQEYCDSNNPCQGTKAAKQLCPCQGGNYKTCGTN